MKQIFVFLLVLFSSLNLFSQTPDKISFQAIVRNNTNELVKNSSIGIKLSVIKNTIDGTVVYTETHKPTTNDNGLINIEIGNGTKLFGDFTTIDWSTGKFFTKTEIDISGGSNYSISSVNQLLSVPYALYAKNAGTVSGLNKSSVGLSNVDNTSDIEKPISNQTKTFIEDALLNKNVWLNGTTSPVNSLGEINNFYINTSNGEYYKKTGSNTWTLLGNLTGPQGPAGQIGANGQTGAQGAQGLQGIQGVQGVAGNNGSLWLNGTSIPSNSDGSINDFYINTSNGNYYKKTGASTWTLQANLVGPAGQTGAQGLQGIQGIQGVQGVAGNNGSLWLNGTSVPSNSDGSINDFYINTSNGNYYKKTGASTWTLQANLVGPAGQTGAQGLQGIQGIQGVQGVAGNNGSLWLNGTSIPSTSDGSINDFYINTSNGNYYKKTGASTWTLQANLVGPAGQTGAQGLQGIQGIQGVQGLQGIPGIQGSAGINGSSWLSGTSIPNTSDGAINDFYINTTNGNYYKKTGATTWTLQANLTGPQGPAASSTTPVYNNRFTSTGSYTVPSGVHTIFLEFTGTKGGSGANLEFMFQPMSGCSTPYITRSGGAGGKAYKIKAVLLVNPGDVISYTIGANGTQPTIERTPCYGSAYYVSPYTATSGTLGASSELFINGNALVILYGGEGGRGAYNLQGQQTAYDGAAATVNGSATFSNTFDNFNVMIISENITTETIPSVLIKH